MESKGKDATELRDKKFLCELQGRGCVITDMYAVVRAFKTKLCLWETQMLQGNLGHFPCCQNITQESSHDEHLHSILRISSAQSLTPDIDGLASNKRCQVSGLDQCASE